MVTATSVATGVLVFFQENAYVRVNNMGKLWIKEDALPKGVHNCSILNPDITLTDDPEKRYLKIDFTHEGKARQIEILFDKREVRELLKWEQKTHKEAIEETIKQVEIYMKERNLGKLPLAVKSGIRHYAKEELKKEVEPKLLPCKCGELPMTWTEDGMKCIGCRVCGLFPQPDNFTRTEKETIVLWNTFIKKILSTKNSQIIERADGRKEWICEHGVGHTIYVPPKHKDDKSWWAHNCDGCCAKHLRCEKCGGSLKGVITCTCPKESEKRGKKD